MGFLRLHLGVRKGTPTAAVLAEAGVPPLYVSWLVRMARRHSEKRRFSL